MQYANSERRFSDSRKVAYIALFVNSLFSGLTSVAIPIALDSAGVSKLGIAAFFVAGAGFAVSYNLVALPRISVRDYPATALRITTGLVPIGLLGIWAFATHPPLLYVGGAAMLAVTMIIPQVFGRVARCEAEDPEGVVVKLRQVMVLGFIIGLGVYSLSAAFGIQPLLVAAVTASIGFAVSWAPYFKRDLPKPISVPESEPGRSLRTKTVAYLGIALILVGLMKSVDTLRSIYLPLFAVSSGIPQAAVAPLFLITAVAEVALLPLLGRTSRKYGPSIILAAISAVGLLTFVMLTLWGSYVSLLGSQLLYAAFAAGFQSIGMVVLAQATGRDVGRGAALFMVVIQGGTVLGATLPLFIDGYSSSIFVIAAALCALCICLAVAAASIHARNRHATLG